jgi:hypothetical protein
MARALFGVPAQPPPPPPRVSPWEALTALATLALALTALVQGSQARFWGLLALAALAAVVRFSGPLLIMVKRRLANRHDEQVAHFALADLQNFANQFGELVSQDRNDTLQQTLQTAFQGPSTAARPRIPSAHWFGSILSELVARMESDAPDLAHFVRAHAEFWTLVSAYSDLCLEPVFQSILPDARAALTSSGRSALEAFRERYVGFRDAYMRFSKDTAAQLKVQRFHPVHVYRPEPFTA